MVKAKKDRENFFLFFTYTGKDGKVMNSISSERTSGEHSSSFEPCSALCMAQHAGAPLLEAHQAPPIAPCLDPQKHASLRIMDPICR